MIANARMYSVTAKAAAAWRTLLEWVVARADVRCDVIDYPAPQPLPALWARADLGCVFMCGYPIACAAKPPTVLAAPVPSPAAYANMPRYWTDIVVRSESPMTEVGQLFGGRFAYTTEDSQSGYQAPRALFALHAKARGKPLFAATVGPLITPRRVIESVLNDEADAGPVDSYALALIRAHEPQIGERLRTIATTMPTPIPPLVAAPGIAPEDAQRLRDALLDVEEASELAPVRSTLLLDGFATVTAESYSELVVRAKTADALGYHCLR